MSAGGTDVSASRASSEAFPQNTAAPTYIIFGDNSGSFGAIDQKATATPTSTAVAATGGSASAHGTGGNGDAASAGVPGYGGVPQDGIGGFSYVEIGLIALAALGVFWAARKS